MEYPNPKRKRGTISQVPHLRIGLGLVVFTSPLALEQILIHLISNVEKYAAAGKSLTLVTKMDNNFLTVDVRDSGVGIAKRFSNRIFKPFFRLDDSITAPSGTGLGLTMDGLIDYPKKLRAMRDKTPVKITNREMQLLQLLYDHAGQVVARDLIFNVC